MKALRLLLYPFVVVLVALLALIFTIPVLILCLVDAAWFRYNNRGKVFLVYTRRHGWNEFIRNNVIPAVANNLEPVEVPRGGRTPWPWQLSRIHAATLGQCKPFLAKVSWRGVRCVGLHELLLPLKQHGARRADVQSKVRDVLARSVG